MTMPKSKVERAASPILNLPKDDFSARHPSSPEIPDEQVG
jgi:hypothetical protein